jgi:hypothetical protein
LLTLKNCSLGTYGVRNRRLFRCIL